MEDLKPINQKSFYVKAKLITENNITKLKSYDTIVASYNHLENKVEVYGWYSKTTAIHINSFLHYYGFDTCTKQQLLNYQS